MITPEKRLQQLLRQQAIEYQEPHIATLLEYSQLLLKWNRVYNLTALNELDEVICKHIIDSLSVLPYIRSNRVLDVGSGAGLPGIPLSILLPDTQFTLLDSNRKKTRFLQQAKTELGLSNIEVICDRVENYRPSQLFPQIVSRAFASIDKMLTLTQHLCHPRGAFLAMKGANPQTDLEQLPKGFKIKALHELQVSGLHAQRFLLVIQFAGQSGV